MKKLFVLVFCLSLVVFACNPEEEKDFQKTDEDCGCEDDSTSTD